MADVDEGQRHHVVGAQPQGPEEAEPEAPEDPQRPRQLPRPRRGHVAEVQVQARDFALRLVQVVLPLAEDAAQFLDGLVLRRRDLGQRRLQVLQRGVALDDAGVAFGDPGVPFGDPVVALGHPAVLLCGPDLALVQAVVQVVELLGEPLLAWDRVGDDVVVVPAGDLQPGGDRVERPLGIGIRAGGQPAERAVDRADPLGQARILRQRLVVEREVPQLRPDEAVDLVLRLPAAQRQGQVQLVGEPLDRRPPVGHQGVVVDERAGRAAGRALRLQGMAQPEEVGAAPGHAVALMQRPDDPHRVPHHDHPGRNRAEVVGDPGPKRHEPAHSRVLDAPQRPVREIRPQPLGQSLPNRRGLRRLEPALRQRPGVVPGRAESLQQFSVQLDDRLMLPEPGLVVPRRRRQQVVAEFDAEQVQHPRQRRGAAAVHPEDEDGGRPVGRNAGRGGSAGVAPGSGRHVPQFQRVPRSDTGLPESGQRARGATAGNADRRFTTPGDS